MDTRVSLQLRVIFDLIHPASADDNVLLNATDAAGFATGVVNDGIQNGNGASIKSEPLLQVNEYV